MDESGFEGVTELKEAREQLRALCVPHQRTEQCQVGEADGRILSTPVTADRAVPHYDRAAMDGYAVVAQDTFDAGDRSPVRLSVNDGDSGKGKAVPVHTGSTVPADANAVVMVEETEQQGEDVLVYDAVATGENVSPAGEDVTSDQHLFDSGHRLTPSDLAVLRSTGHDTVTVAERPRISVIPTGEELVGAGTDPDPGEVVETNGLLVSGLVTRWGGSPSYRDIVTDETARLRSAVESDLDHDIVVTLGGTSVGDRDLIPDVVDDLGTVVTHGVTIKPGHPVGFGVVERTPVLLLPGYPVSCLVNSVQFLRPAISWLAGTEPTDHPTVSACLTQKIRSAPGERTFARVTLGSDPEDTGLTAEPVRVSGAGVMSSVTRADGWVVVPESREGIPADETVTVQRWEGTFPDGAESTQND